MPVMHDGFSTTITPQGYPSLYLVLPEKEVTPPGIDMGGQIPISTMRNTEWRTFMPKSLKTMTNIEFVAAYDPDVWTANAHVRSLLGKNIFWTVRYPASSAAPTGHTLGMYGWLDKFQPNAHKEGEQPTANCIVVPSNLNAAYSEAGPVYS